MWVSNSFSASFISCRGRYATVNEGRMNIIINKERSVGKEW
jgi:hypothetical protein